MRWASKIQQQKKKKWRKKENRNGWAIWSKPAKIDKNTFYYYLLISIAPSPYIQWIVLFLSLHNLKSVDQAKGNIRFGDSFACIFDINLEIDAHSTQAIDGNSDLEFLTLLGFLVPIPVNRSAELDSDKHQNQSNSMQLTPHAEFAIPAIKMVPKIKKSSKQTDNDSMKMMRELWFACRNNNKPSIFGISINLIVVEPFWLVLL